MDSERPSSKKKQWEYPWTVEEMRKAAGQWSLASDVGLFEHLQEFSQKLLSQTHEIQEQVDSLNHDAKLTNIRLHNVFNDFVMLANTQFVENRVYDEEVVGVEQTDGNKKLEEKQEKTQEQKEMELIPKIKEAISLGLNVFDTAYEKLDMNIANSESDDEDATNRPNVYLEPKDPYLYRPLPCLIGSDQFFQTENLGLGNLLLVDEKDDQESDHLSDGEVGGPPVPKPPPLPEGRLEPDSDESDEDLFGERKAEADIQNDVNDDEDAEGEKALKDDKANAAKNPLSDFHSELSRKLGGDSALAVGPPPKRQGSVDKEVVPSARPRGSKAKTQHPEDGGDLFPSALDEPTDDIFSRPSRLFSTRPTLFDDDEDDSGGMFGSQKSQPKPEKPAPPASTSNKPVPASKEPDVRATTTQQSGRIEISEEKRSSKGKGLFDVADDDEEEDLFATKPTAAARQTKETKKPAVSLFDEDDDESDIFSSMNKSSVPAANKPAEDENKNKPRLPAGAVSIFGGGDNLFKAAIQKAKADDNNVDDVAGRSTISDKSLSKPSAVAKSLKPATGSSSPSSSTMSSSSLFAEDPEIFTTKSKSSTADLTKELSQPKAKTGFSLFADDEDDDLFASLSKPVTSTGNKTAGKEPEAKKKTKTFLFDDDDDDGDSGDLFALPKSSAAKDEKKNITFVDETAPPKVSIETKPAAAKERAKEVTKPNKVSLFSGSDDDEDDLFSLRKSPAKTKVTTENPPPPAAQSGLVKAPGKRQSLFDDDNFLFNAQDDDGPSIDLFKPSAAKVENKSPQKVSTSSASAEATSAPIEKSSPPPIAAPRAASTRLFGSLDDDEDDLFSTLMTKSFEKSKSSSKPDEARGIKTTAESKQKPKNSLDDIFGEKTTPKEKTAQKEKSAAAEVKGTDTSAVKLFDDPLGSETVAIKAVPKTPDIARAPLSPLLQPQGASDDLFGDDEGLSTSDSKREQSLSPKSSTSPKVLPKAATKGDRISKLQSSINIDPTSHLPPKIKKVEPEKTESDGVDFSLPAQTQTLHSLSKDRAKIPIKRRPPTRKHAESHSSESHNSESHNRESHNGFGIETDSKEFVLGYDSTADVKTESVKRQTAGDDLFSSLAKSPIVPDAQRGESSIGARTATISSANDNKSETREPASSKVEPPNVRSGVDVREKKETGTGSKVNVPDANDDDDIFAGRSLKTTSASQSTSDAKRGKNAAADSDEDDLFGEKKLLSSSTQAPAASKTKAPDAKVLSSEKPPASSPSQRKDDDDDLFGTKALIKPTAPVAAERAAVPAARAENSSKKPDKGLLSSDDDDIFNVPKNVSASAAAKTKAASTVKAAAADDVDDDDIFANSSLAPKGARKTTGNSKTKVKEPVFDDDDDDIFASIPSSKVKKPVSQPKKEIATDENDLFATAPPSSSRLAPKKLGTKDEDLFHDDTDIFANIPSAKPKEKKSQGKNVMPTGTPLFTNDPDDIFADAAVTAKPSKVASDMPKSASKTKSKDDYDDIFDDPLNVLQK